MENNTNNTNTILLGVLLILAYFLIKNMLDTKPMMPQQPATSRTVASKTVVVSGYPTCDSRYHNCVDFWYGYRDGYYGKLPQSSICAEYFKGYQVGSHERRCGYPNQPYFYKYCPPGLSVSTPNFFLNFKLF